MICVSLVEAYSRREGDGSPCGVKAPHLAAAEVGLNMNVLDQVVS
jgi:hypothetical protein